MVGTHFFWHDRKSSFLDVESWNDNSKNLGGGWTNSFQEYDNMIVKSDRFSYRPIFSKWFMIHNHG